MSREELLDRLRSRARNPVAEAQLMKELMEAYGFSQRDLASIINVSQMQVSRILSLLTLEPEFLDRISEGTLRHSTAFELAKLPVEERLKSLGEEKIRLEDVKRRRRDLNIEGLLDLVEEPLKGISREEPVLEEVERWWAGLDLGEKIRVYGVCRKVDE